MYKILMQMILLIIISFNFSVLAQIEKDEVKEKIKQQILSKTDTTALKNLSLQFKSDYIARKYEGISKAVTNQFVTEKRLHNFSSCERCIDLYNRMIIINIIPGTWIFIFFRWINPAGFNRIPVRQCAHNFLILVTSKIGIVLFPSNKRYNYLSLLSS